MVKSAEGSLPRYPRKTMLLWGGAAALSVALCLGAAGCASPQQEASQDQGSNEPQGIVQTVEGDEWAAYLPKVTTKPDGTRVQKTPYAGMNNGYFFPKDWNLYNTYYLNADQRGCSSCHELDETLMATMDHWVYWGNYDNEPIRYNDCMGCHDAYGVSLQNFQDAMHDHMNSTTFVDMGGNCESCHYITNENQFEMWDYVKYDVLRGITDVAADDVDVDITWNQDEITPVEKMFVQKKAKNNWGTTAWFEEDDNIFNTYTVAFKGEMDNPREMTIQQMIDEFGTETRTIANHCTINATGGAYIYQAEVTGVPFKKIFETLGVHEGANMLDAIGVDGYDIPMYTQVALDSDPLLVFEMNGERLDLQQGYPLSIWFGDGVSGGQFTRYLTEVNIAHSDDPGGAYNNYNQGVFGDYVDPKTKQPINTPNAGVLTAETGQIFTAGQPIHFEGYAHAFEEDVVKLEFSFDHGATWKEVPVSGTDKSKWVYWKMDINSFTDPGAYLVKIRVTSQDAEGNLHVNDRLVDFMMNVE